MSEESPLMPVKPSGMELVYYYPCPYCQREIPLVAPTQPARMRCEFCKNHFPVVPADEKTIHFLKTIMDRGRAGIDPGYV